MKNENIPRRGGRQRFQAICGAEIQRELRFRRREFLLDGEQAQALEDQGVQVHVPVKRSVNNQGDGELFDRTCFTYEVQADAYVCPAHKLLLRKQQQI